MGKKKPYPRSFARRLTWRIMLTMLVVMGLVSVAIFFAGWVTVAAGMQVIAERHLESENQTIRRALSDVYVASVNTVPQIEENVDKPERLYGLMEQMVKLNPRIRSCGISFTADYFPQKGHWFCPYVIRNDSDDVVVQTVGDKQHDYLKAEWFTQALASKDGFWSKPFIDGTDQKTPLASWLAPIHNRQGKTVAVLGVDMSLEWLSEKVSSSRVRVGSDSLSEDEWDPSFQIYSFVINSDGTYIVHPDHKRIVHENYFTYAKESPDTLDDYIGRQMTTGKEGTYNFESEELTIEGEKVQLFYMPIKYVDWSIAWVIPKIYIDIAGYILGGILITLIALGMLVVLIVGRSTIKSAVKPLKQLSKSSDEVAKGKFDTQLPVIKSRDEIHQLRDSFEKMQLSLTEYIDELKTTTAQKASIESELKVAHDIQMSMLPKTFPPYPERDDIDIYGTLTPAKDVGGDLFDFYIRDEKLFFCVGDVSGKGVPASLVMAMTRSLFRNISTHVAEPHIIVRTLNTAIADGNETTMFVTLFLGVLDLHTGLLRYSNAGHNSPLIIGSNVSVLPCDANVPIGVMPDWSFTCQEILFQPQTSIFLYTDGLNEAEDIAHAQFGEQRILQVAESLVAERTDEPAQIVDKMAEAVHAFVNGAEQSDDLTMLAIKYKKQDA